MASYAARLIERWAGAADIRVGGDRPWDVRVLDERVYRRVLTTGTLGLGEAYMDGWWDCDAIDQMVEHAQDTGLASDLSTRLAPLQAAGSAIHNQQSKRRAREVGRRHYDVGNDLYRRMLDSRMMYSCAYWRRATTLDEAQQHKLDLIANKLGLEPGMRVLDIGCGWGGAAAYFAETRGCDVVGITISEQQAKLATERCAGLPIDIRLQDYRDLDETFDRVYSIGMFEHVGVRNYRTYLQACRRLLRDPDGLTLLHTIGGSRSRRATDPWVERYIFPNSMLPSAKQITEAAEGILQLQDWHNFGADYDRTLMSWHANVESAWDDLPDYDERFRRMWRYYLLSSAGSFRSGNLQLWQIVFSRDGLSAAYRPDGIR
ncbi:MAG: cyclopropane-fatty-acyl-phospholipid synthase [Acidimicrobiaceae bacterium]|nr:cyclopropane-fatty-acyl-phospholipid synthase [Acidimicrobiaceae bacterium]